MIEKLDLLTQIIIAGCALFALKQINLSKKSFQLNSKRESVRYASELIDYYLNKIIPLSPQGTKEIDLAIAATYRGEFNLKSFTIEEIEQAHPELKKHFKETFEREQKRVKANLEQMFPNLKERNSIESFAAPFIAGVADEQIAFTAVGRTFCHTVKDYYSDYCIVRTETDKGFNPYENTIQLYNIWSERIKKHGLKNKEEIIALELKNLRGTPIPIIGEQL